MAKDEVKAAKEERTDAQRDRADAQEKELDAQRRGDLREELKGFAKEVVADHRQFADDVVKDSDNPERRVDEEQGTPTRPGHEPRESSSAD